MRLDDNPDYQTIWQLAHNWAKADPSESDESALSPELRMHIHRLLEASDRQEISVQTSQRKILIDDSFFALVADLTHIIKYKIHLRGGKVNRTYLNSLYVKRNEVIDWCTKIYVNPPPCWTQKQLPDEQVISKEIKNYRPKDETEDRIRCQAIACALWELDSAIHPKHLARSEIMRRFGNGRQYSEDTVRNWITEVDPQKDRRKSGRPPDIPYKIDLKTDPQISS